jgi:hypothetical protein
MRATYKALGHTIAGLVAVQAAVLALAVFGLWNWIDEGNTLTKARIDSDAGLGSPGEVGFMLHGVIGMMLIPLLAIVFLVISFFAKDVSGAVKWAGLVFLTVLIQVVLGIVSFGVPGLGALHGLNALAIAWLGWHAAKVAGAAEVAGAPTYGASRAR